jgi:hypothetical protein
MSEQPENDGRGAPGPTDRVHAGVRHGWWPGWIWAIPIAALLVVIWLGARTLLAGGTDITIRLTDAHNLKKENTDVVLRGTQVGHVTGIELTPDGTAVIVSASIDKDAAKFLTTGTRFLARQPVIARLAPLRPHHHHGPGSRQESAALSRPRARAHRPVGHRAAAPL